MPAFSYRATRLMTLSVIPFFLLVGTFWGFMAENIPPFDGAYPAGDLTRYFVDRAVWLRIAYSVAIPSWSFLMLWSLAVFNIMRRVEGGDHLLSYTQLMGGALTTLIPTFACIFWLSAAYRPEQTSPEIIRMLFDTGWLMMDLTFAITTIQYIAMGIVFLKDPRPTPLIPRWLAWLAIWLAIEFLAEIIMPSFRSGPFSWSGLFNYWIPFFGPFSLIALMSFFMMKAVARIEREDMARVE